MLILIIIVIININFYSKLSSLFFDFLQLKAGRITIQNPSVHEILPCLRCFRDGERGTARVRLSDIPINRGVGSTRVLTADNLALSKYSLNI